MTDIADHPSDWTTVTLGSLLYFSNGVNADKTAYGRGTPFINVLDVITHEGLTEDHIPGRVSLSPHVAVRYQVRYGDLVFNRTSETQDEVGLAAVYLGQVPVVFGGFVFRGRPKTPRLNSEFCRYFLRSPSVRKQITARGQGGIRANIGQRDLKTVVVALPPLGEQRAIASVLADIDRFIASLEQLIAKKENISDGILRELVTGHTRLPGFTRPWVETKAGAVGTFRGGSGFPVAFQGVSSGTYPFFKVSDMNSPGNGLFMTKARHYVTENERKQIGAVRFPKDAIVFAKVGAGIFLERKRILAQPSCIDNNMAAMVVDPATADVRFLHYALTKFRLSSLVATGALPSLNSRQLRSIPLSLPTALEEQRAIAQALDGIGSEIRLLQTRLDKAAAIKQGMMQELLTGRTRLPLGDRETVAA